MARKKISNLVLHEFARERRVIVADWRIRVVYLRVAHENNFAVPNLARMNALIRQLTNEESIMPIAGVPGVFRVITPYASAIPAPEEVIVQEANPTGFLSHYTAVAYHGLTDEIPADIFATTSPKEGVRLPLGTTPDDWVDAPAPVKRKPSCVENRTVVWSKVKPEWDFGCDVGYFEGIPVYISDLERTLLDGVRFPEKVGGHVELFRVWSRGKHQIRLERMIGYVNRFGQLLLRQRVGFLLESLGFAHPIFDEWASASLRGSSARLIASLDFSPHFSDRWNLSLNVPESVLDELRD